MVIPPPTASPTPSRPVVATPQANRSDARDDDKSGQPASAEIDSDDAVEQEQAAERDQDEPEDDAAAVVRRARARSSSCDAAGGRSSGQSRTGSASLCSTAQSAACVRDASPSLPRMFET